MSSLTGLFYVCIKIGNVQPSRQGRNLGRFLEYKMKASREGRNMIFMWEEYSSIHQVQRFVQNLRQLFHQCHTLHARLLSVNVKGVEVNTAQNIACFKHPLITSSAQVFIRKHSDFSTEYIKYFQRYIA